MDTIAKINKAKTSLKGSITRIETYVDKVARETTETELIVKLKKIDQLQKNLDGLKQNFFELEETTTGEIKLFEEDVELLENRLEDLEVRVKQFINSSNRDSFVTATDKNQNTNMSIATKIPPIILPTFSGKYQDFSNFKNQFDDLITHNDQLSQSQKLYYLHSCLTNDVKEYASSFDTFSSLYDALESRYSNKRLIIDIHVQAILDFKTIERENAKEIRELIDCIEKNLRALKVLKYEQNELFDIFLINIILKKLDKESRKNFELNQKLKEVPTFKEFMSFLEQREAVLMSVARNCTFENRLMVRKTPSFLNKTKTLFINEHSENKSCPICREKIPHPVYRCKKFLELSPQKRFDLIKVHKLCELCLRKFHKKADCTSTYVCICGKRHSKTLCFKHTGSNASKMQVGLETRYPASSPHHERENVNKQAESSSESENPSTLCNTALSNLSQQKKSVLLATGNILLQNKNGKFIKCTAIFDSASNINILTKKMCDFLGIKPDKMLTSVSGLNSTKQNLKGKMNAVIANNSGSFVENIEFLVTEKITGLTPSVNLDVSKIKIPDFLELADPCFFEAKEIHALLNADIFFRVMKHNVYKVDDELLFRETEFGWVASGRLNETECSAVGSCFLLHDSSIENTLKRFFDLESLGIKDDPCFREEDQAMKIFENTVQYKDGRYFVELPFRKDGNELSDNFLVAKQRFNNLWRRFQNDTELYSQYQDTINDYINQGIVEKVDTSIVNKGDPIYYLPHQAVKKEGRVTTSTRIVFDAASHQANELSLNDCLWPGPNLYPNLIDVLISFRLNRIAITSDIRQAFLQICLADKHKDAVRFLWTNSDPRVDKKPTTQVYRFNRVNFGVNASPFLLAATIKHHIEKYREDYPSVVRHLDSYMYVDDWITGRDTPEEALCLSRCAKNIMQEAGMCLRKWVSNDSSLMNQWSAEGFDTYPVDTSVSLGTSKTKVLGLTWQTQDDCLTLDTKGLQEFISTNETTKRSLLRAIGKIFDPLGLLTPFTIRVKCLIQEIWEKKIAWDEDLPPNIVKSWLNWCNELPQLEELKIPRLVLDSTTEETDDVIEIHVFCDASKQAYGASVYVKVQKKSKVLVNLVTSKTRVAPLKSVTLPRLELLGALVAARLSSKVQKIIGEKKQFSVFHWTDSQIVLFWIKGSPRRWKQFVANRVREITELTDPNTWFHCSGKENPSDLLSRGLSAESILQNDKWWKGPSFLQSNELIETVYEYSEPNEEEYLAELRSKDNQKNIVLTLNFNKTIFDYLINRNNKFLTIVRILSFIFRFVFNCRNPEKKRDGALTSVELMEAEEYLIKQFQIEMFSTEVSALMSGLEVSPKSKILNLSPYLDNKGIMRVGGRLQNSQLPYSGKHPIILPSKSKLTELIVRYYHERYLHLGPQHLLFQIRQNYWPVHGRNICRKVLHDCVICFKANPKMCSQKMGNLPKERVTPDKVFNSTGIDLCGPFSIKNKYQRKGPEIKVYICIFICLVTKAVHLEIISDLTSEALIAALKRFVARRGRCNKIFSDNGTNLVGANSALKALNKLVRDREESLFAFFAEENIEWSFIPPRSPNWGGLWEANIKAFKYHFKRVAGNSVFNYEELLTLTVQIEAILNSRPLTPLTSDIEDLEILTPGHFLIGHPITAIPEPSLTHLPINRLNSWQKITKSVQTIWKKWSLSYLNSLQQRKKWLSNEKNLKIGDMVLIKEENLPPCKWLMGRIVALYPGKDNNVRVVDVKTSKGIYKRSINKLSVLPIES